MELRYDRKPGPTKMRVWQNVRDKWALMWRHRLERRRKLIEPVA